MEARRPSWGGTSGRWQERRLPGLLVLALVAALLPLLAIGSASTSEAVAIGTQRSTSAWQTPLARAAAATLTVAPSTAVEGERVLFTVQATTTFRRAGRIEYRAAGAWHVVRDFTMPASGTRRLRLAMTTQHVWRAVLPAVELDGQRRPALATARSTVLLVEPTSVLSASATLVEVRNTPARPGRTVTLYRSVDGGPFEVWDDPRTEGEDGTASWPVEPPADGRTYRYRAQTEGFHGAAAVDSDVVVTGPEDPTSSPSPSSSLSVSPSPTPSVSRTLSASPTASASPTTVPSASTSASVTASSSTSATASSSASPSTAPAGAPEITSVSVTPNPLTVDTLSGTTTLLSYAVLVHNPGTTGSAAAVVVVGVPSDGTTVLTGDPQTDLATAVVAIPTLAAGESRTLVATGDLPPCDGCEGSAVYQAVACLRAGSALSGCAATPLTVDFVGSACQACWPDGTDLALTVVQDVPEPVTIGDAPVTVPVTLHVTNRGADPLAPGLPVEVQEKVGDPDPDFGWVAPPDVVQPARETVELPALAPGESADVATELVVPAYESTRRASTHLWARLREPGVPEVLAESSLAARLVPTYDGDAPDFAVDPASLTVPRFFTRVGASDTRQVGFTVANLGGSDPGDPIEVAVQVGSTPQWDPAAPAQASYEFSRGLTGSASRSRSVTWSGPPPSGPAYVVVCADTAASAPVGDPASFWPHEETSETNNCASAPVTFVDLDAAPATVDGYAGPLPTPDPLSVSVTDLGGGTGGRFGWQRPGEFPWSPPRTDDQVWTLDPASGVHATVTLGWQTFIEDLDIEASPVAIAPDAAGGDPLPFDGVIGALLLTPGQALAEKPFTVDFVLDPAALDGVVPGDLVAFAADQDGSDVRLLPVQPGADGAWALDRVRVPLAHFGVVGLATATPAQRAALALRVPSDDDQQLEADAAAATLAARAAALVSVQRTPAGTGTRIAAARSDASSAQELRDRLVTRYNEVLVPALDAAYSGGMLEMEVSTQLSLEWLRTAALLFDETDPVIGPLADELWQRVSDLLDRHADLVKQRCVQGGGFGALRAMLGEIRQLELLGHEAKATELTEALGACSSFQVSYDQSFSDENTNASLAGGLTGRVTLTAPSEGLARTGAVPSGTAPLQWTSYSARTTDSYDTFDQSGNVVGQCSVTKTDTAASGSFLDVYVKDYGLTFLRGGGHRRLLVSLWLFGSVLDPAIGYDVPVVIHRQVSSGCPDIADDSFDMTDKPYPGDPAIQLATGGFRVLRLDWADGHYEHTWSVTRTGGEHPTHEELRIAVDPSFG